MALVLRACFHVGRWRPVTALVRRCAESDADPPIVVGSCFETMIFPGDPSSPDAITAGKSVSPSLLMDHGDQLSP